MRDHICLGPNPSDEKCVQLGSDNYEPKAIAECQRYIKLIRKKFGKEPNGAQLAVKSNAHDFGTYYEVVCFFDDEISDAKDYAFAMEGHLPVIWDDDALVDLSQIPPIAKPKIDSQKSPESADESNLIFSYTREQALADGQFIDMTEWAKETGFKVPVAMTNELWSEINEDHPYEDLRGRAHDILMLAHVAAKNAPEDESLVEFVVRYADSDHRLWMTMEADGKGQPALTIMRPEDY